MQQLPNGLFRITNQSTGASKDVKAADLPQYGLQAPKAAAGQGFDIQGFFKALLGKAADVAPDVLGTAGNIGGSSLGADLGVLGGAAVPVAGETGASEVAGGVAGSRVGGALGSSAGQAAGKGAQEFIKENLLGEKKKPMAENVGEMGKSAGEGLIYGVLPGGNGAQSVIKKLGTRFLGGFGVGAGANLVSDIGNKDSLPENLKNAAISGTATGIMNSVLFPTVGSILKGVFQHAPAKAGQILQDQAALVKRVAVDEPAQLEKDLQDASIAHRFGIDNVDFAKKNKLIDTPDFTIAGTNKEIGRVKEMATANEKQLQEKLKGVKIDAYPIYEEVQKLRGYLPDASSKTKALLDGFMAKVADSNGGRIGIDSKIDASAVNELKRGIKFDPLQPNSIENQIYSTLKDQIEQASGVPKDVATLNDTAHRLSVAYGRLKKLRDGFDTSEKYSLGGIKKAVDEAKKGNMTEVAHKINFLTAPIDMAGYMVGHFPGYIIASHIMPPIKQSIQENPEAMSKIAKKGASVGEKLVRQAPKTGEGIDQVMNFLKQLAIRHYSQNVPGSDVPSPYKPIPGSIDQPQQMKVEGIQN